MVVYAFGEIVPDSVIEELLDDGFAENEITTDFIEVLYHYESLDNE